MSSWALKAGLAGLAIVAASAYAIAQMSPPHSGMHGPTGQGTGEPATADDERRLARPGWHARRHGGRTP